MTMRVLELNFSDSEVRRLKRVAGGRSDKQLVFLCRKAILEYLELIEGLQGGHFPQRPHPSAFARERREQNADRG